MSQWEVYSLCILAGIVIGEALFIFGMWIDKNKE